MSLNSINVVSPIPAGTNICELVEIDLSELQNGCCTPLLSINVQLDKNCNTISPPVPQSGALLVVNSAAYSRCIAVCKQTN